MVFYRFTYIVLYIHEELEQLFENVKNIPLHASVKLQKKFQQYFNALYIYSTIYS